MGLKRIVKKSVSKSKSRIGNLMPVTFTKFDYQRFEKKIGAVEIIDDSNPYIESLRKDGYLTITDFLSSEECNSIINSLEASFQKYPEYTQKHTDIRIFGMENLSYKIKEKFNRNEFLLELANAYNQFPTGCLFTLGNKVSYNKSKLGSGGGWHRDSFYRQFKAIVYLNDVNEDGGPFQLIRNSHKLGSIVDDIRKAKLNYNQNRLTEEDINKIIDSSEDRLVTITGKKGTLLLVDTSIIHRGKPVINKSFTRYALTNYYFHQDNINESWYQKFSPNTYRK